MRQSILRILLAIYFFPLVLVCGSLSVPPGDFMLFALMFAIAIAGLVLSMKMSQGWRRVWTVALVVSLLGGALELFAGKRIAERRSASQSRTNSTTR